MRNFDVRTCTPKCKSKEHAEELISLITKTHDTQTILSALLQCCNCQKVHDKLGRYLLHMAASCGRAQVCEWLIKLKKADLNLKTSESGWTALHCAAYYGQIDALIILIRNGANLSKLDFAKMTPLEHLALDKWLENNYQAESPDYFDVYSWGNNINFNLGMGHDMKKANPELVEFFKKSNIQIVEIVMSKFHSVFLSSTGNVYSCGFGVDGRLGHDNELTLVAPKQIDQLKNEKCVQIAASRNNTYMLTSDGVVFSCGTNEFKQLGQVGIGKSLAPKPIVVSKRLKGKRIKQVECIRFHCVLLTSNSEVHTFGLNAGQLGHPNEMVASASSNTYNNTVCYIAEPRLVTGLSEPGMDIELIATSEGCTVCLQRSKNILHVFNDYKIKRLHYIKETGSPFKKIRVRGGKLDHTANPELKWIEDLDDSILIVGLTESNLLYIWRETESIWKNLTWSPNKQLKILDFDLNIQGVIFCTIQGQCYRADFNRSNKVSVKSATLNNSLYPSTPSTTVQMGTDKLKYSPTQTKDSNETAKAEVLDVTQVPLVNRCFKVVNDLKARNFFALQYLPTMNMRCYPIQLRTTIRDEMNLFLNENSVKKTTQSDWNAFRSQESFYDVELKYSDTVFGLHKFILLSRCPKFFLKLNLVQHASQVVDLAHHLNSQKFTVHAFEILIKYIYTNECEREFLRQTFKAAKVNSETGFLKFLADFKETCVDKFGLAELKACFDSKVCSKQLKELKLNESKSHEERIELISEFFAKLLIANRKQLKFWRHSYTELYDCEIECNNNESIKCHKCILISRSDYFRNMFLGSWIESSSNVIRLPFDADLMQLFVDYLYTDDIQIESAHCVSSIKSKTEKEIELLFNLYVLSDQLLVERLKNLCEFKLANLANLRNCVELFEFACSYNASQLKEYCMEFISQNLNTIVESKMLEGLDFEMLKEISSFYRSYFGKVASRRITPYTGGLNPEQVELVPYELIYDQKFVDSFMSNEMEERKKQTSKTSESSEVSLQQEPKINSKTNSPEIVETLDRSKGSNESNDYSKEEELFKWEKVKKKNKGKQKLENPQSNNKQSNEVRPTVVGAFFTDNDREFIPCIQKFLLKCYFLFI
jgi:hypothetical protein